ncbi:TPA: DUF6682 family protein [Vibrio harveyi]
MAITKIVDVIKQVQILLQDESAVRWSRDELLSYLLDAQLAIVNRRPDANMKTTHITTNEGTHQELPTDGIRLMRVVRNVSGRAVREIPMQLLDDQIPDWHRTPVAPLVPSSFVELYCYDVTNPRVFYTYPYVAANVELEIIYSFVPNMTVVIPDATWDSDSTTISVEDSYKNAIIDWILYRAYSKDADYSANSSRAQLHMQAFNLAVQSKTQADVAITPSEATGGQ